MTQAAKPLPYGASAASAADLPAEAEIIHAPNTLRAKVGPRFAAVDAEAIARAEAALAGLSSQFDGWLREEAQKLEAAQADVHAQGPSPARMAALYTRAHDLKGLGGTYGFPLISRVAGSLCRLMDDPAARLATPLFLIDAHVDAIRAVIRGDIRDPAHPVGVALCEALETRVRQHAPTDARGAPLPR